MIINEARKMAIRQILNQKNIIYAFSSNKDKAPEKKKSDDLSEETLGNYRGIVYKMRQDSEVAN